MKKNPIFLIAGITLFIALGDLPYAYYQLLRFFICGVGAYGAYFAYQQKKTGWAWILGIIALLFNPFIKFYLDKEIWKILDLIGGILFVIYFSKDKKAGLLKKGINMNASKKVLKILLKDKKTKNIFLVGLALVIVMIISSFWKTDYYNKGHFLLYKEPYGFGNGSNGIVIISQDWKIIPNNKNTDLILWQATFKNNSLVPRKLSVWSYFKDESFMELGSDYSTNSGMVLSKDEYLTFNGRKTIERNISKRIKFMNTAIASEHKESGSFGEFWKSDDLN